MKEVEEEEKQPILPKNVSKSSASESISASVPKSSSEDLIGNEDQFERAKKFPYLIQREENSEYPANNLCVPSSNQKCHSQVFSNFEFGKYQTGPNLNKLRRESLGQIIEEKSNEMDMRIVENVLDYPS